MKDLYAVLRQKEQDIVRVRREMQALRAVIPLLADDLPASELAASELPASEEDERNLQSMVSAQSAAESTLNGMADLETYYPFVKHMRQSGS
jgi:hypothetical protein